MLSLFANRPAGNVAHNHLIMPVSITGKIRRRIYTNHSARTRKTREFEIGLVLVSNLIHVVKILRKLRLKVLHV